jgi:hypothetical protein
MRRDSLIPVQLIEVMGDGSTSVVYEGRWATLPRPGEPVSIARREVWRVVQVRHVVDYAGVHHMAELLVESGSSAA